MIAEIIKKQLVISIPNKNKGKLRFKKRDHIWQIGKSHASKKEKFNEKVYLEWQISYDIAAQNLESYKKKTSLRKNKFKFKGANGKEKYPYELSEFLYFLIQTGILKKSALDSLKSEIENYNEFLMSCPKINKQKKIIVNKLPFDSAVTELPTYYLENADKTYIEVIVQKQQYASGFQPMVYFCVPIACFSNFREIIGLTSTEKLMSLKYVVDKSATDNILNLFKTLAMASESHKRDVVEILKALKRGLNYGLS